LFLPCSFLLAHFITSSVSVAQLGMNQDFLFS